MGLCVFGRPRASGAARCVDAEGARVLAMCLHHTPTEQRVLTRSEQHEKGKGGVLRIFCGVALRNGSYIHSRVSVFSFEDLAMGLTQPPGGLLC